MLKHDLLLDLDIFDLKKIHFSVIECFGGCFMVDSSCSLSLFIVIAYCDSRIFSAHNRKVQMCASLSSC